MISKTIGYNGVHYFQTNPFGWPLDQLTPGYAAKATGDSNFGGSKTRKLLDLLVAFRCNYWCHFSRLLSLQVATVQTSSFPCRLEPAIGAICSSRWLSLKPETTRPLFQQPGLPYLSTFPFAVVSCQPSQCGRAATHCNTQRRQLPWRIKCVQMLHNLGSQYTQE